MGGGGGGGARHYWLRRLGGIEPLSLSAPSDLKSEPNTSQDRAGRKGEGGTYTTYTEMRGDLNFRREGRSGVAIAGFAG